LLLAKGYTVRGLDIRSSEKLSSLKKYEHVIGDLTLLDDVRRACHGVDTVFHVAAISELKRGSNQSLFEAINVTGTKNVIDAACECGVQRLIYVSSASVVFTESGVENGTEDLPYSALLDAYTQSKAKAEQLVLAANGRRVTPPLQTVASPTSRRRSRSSSNTEVYLMTCALRPHAIYGPGDPLTWPKIAKAATEGKLKRIIGDGMSLTSVSFVDNVAYGLIQAAEALRSHKERPCGEAYNINDGTPLNQWEYYFTIGEAAGVPRKQMGTSRLPATPIYYLGWANEIFSAWSGGDPTVTRWSVLLLTRHHYYSIEKAKRDFGYEPAVPTQEALKITVAWLKKEGANIFRHLTVADQKQRVSLRLSVWLFIVSTLTLTGFFQALFATEYLKILFGSQPNEVTPLASRIFACWALLATIIGYHAAADINNKTLYRLALFTFYLALGFYGFETCVTKTMPFFPALLPAIVIACVCLSIIWMTTSSLFTYRHTP
jgi:nucleoside-diphosphate-sugar epimerase